MFIVITTMIKMITNVKLYKINGVFVFIILRVKIVNV